MEPEHLLPPAVGYIEAISPRESAVAIEQSTETSLLHVNWLTYADEAGNNHKFQNKHGGPPAVKAVATTVLSASHVAIRHSIKLMTLQTEKSLRNSCTCPI